MVHIDYHMVGQHPKNAQEVIEWLEQTVAGLNLNPTSFVWNGTSANALPYLGDQMDTRCSSAQK